jgi:hypothetical protein
MYHPYSSLPDRALWRKGVAEVAGESHMQIYERKWPIAREMKIATAGSCFAQHIGRNLREGGFNVLDFEPAPSGLPIERHHEFGYSIYSARYGNVYTARQMLQVAQEAFGERPKSAHVWERGGRYFDALRPTVEPNGLTSPDVVRAHRAYHLELVRALLLNADVFIFTLGLTETWIDRDDGTVFPVCPGVIAGEFDSERYAFHNLSFVEIRDDLQKFRELLHRKQPTKLAKILLTVSPVPLTATASGSHVMPATVYSKSVLRAVAGDLSARHADIDYFPSYEIITNPWRVGVFYDSNLRSVSKRGVETVMMTFMAAHGGAREDRTEDGLPVEALHKPPFPVPEASALVAENNDMDLVCDEELLDAFGARG